MSERKYVAISIKHTEYKWRFGMPCILWGNRQTKDDEPRCFSGYTKYLSCAERYSIGEFEAHGYSTTIIKPNPVTITYDFCRRYKNYDTVLVSAADYAEYCKVCCLATMPPEVKE